MTNPTTATAAIGALRIIAEADENWPDYSFWQMKEVICAHKQLARVALEAGDVTQGLLEACQAMLTSDGLIGNQPSTLAAYRMMQAAIARATGEPTRQE